VVWIVIVALLAVAGAVVLVVYALGLRHRAEGLKAEIDVTSGRVREIAGLLGSVEIASLRRD